MEGLSVNICICCIAKDEDKYIEEWIDYHLKLGFDHVYVFQNQWRYPGDGKYRENFHVHWLVQDGETQQVNAYNRFLHDSNTWVQEHDWVAFIDVDEFVCVRDARRGLKDILRAYSGYPALALNWRLFGSSGLKYDGKENSVLKRFVMCQRSLNRHVKLLVNMKFMRDSGMYDKVGMVLPHNGNFAAANLEGNAVIGPFNYQNLDQEHALEIAHFAVKTREECMQKCARGRADCSVKRNFEEFFSEHDINEIENTTLRDFYFGKEIR